MDSGSGRKRVEWHSWRGTAITQGQGQAVHSIWLENTAIGEGQGDEVSQAGKQGSVMPYKGIWICSLAMGVWGSGIAGDGVGQSEVTLLAIGEEVRGKGDLRQVGSVQKVGCRYWGAGRQV